VDAPTPDEIRQHSPLLKDRYPDDADDPSLELLVAITAPLVGDMTGRSIGGSEGEEVPAGKRVIATRAIAMKSEQLDSAVGTVKGRKRSLGRGNLASFSAGSYSESYFGPDQAMRAKQLDADPLFSELLWSLCTEDKRLYWLAIWDPDNFMVEAEGGVVSFEYGNRPNYSGGGPSGWWG
jgi:hypothetical protein